MRRGAPTNPPSGGKMIKKALFLGALAILAPTASTATSHGAVFETKSYYPTASPTKVKRCNSNRCVIQVSIRAGTPCGTVDGEITELWLRDIPDDQYPVVVYWKAPGGWAFQDQGIEFKQPHPYGNPQKLSNPHGWSVELPKQKVKTAVTYWVRLVNVADSRKTCVFDPGLITDW